MKSFLSWWVKNPIAANLSMFTLVLAGLLSYFYSIEKEPFPTVRQPIMDVSMTWRGAGPRDIEEQVIIRFEEVLKSVEDIKSVVSRATEGRARITITGKERVDRRKFADEVREKINSVNALPADADRAIVSERVNRQAMIRLALHGDISVRTLSQLARDIRKEVGALPLISNVNILGAGDEEISIEISEQAMSLYKISFDEIANAIKASSINSSTGTVRDAAGTLQLTVRSRAEQQYQFEDIVIRKNVDGASLYLRDIANVVDGVRDTRNISMFDGERAVLIDVMNADHMNIVSMSEHVENYLTRKQQQLPAGVTLTLWSNWNDAYQSRLATILENAGSGLLLVFILLILFLQPKVALWVTAGIATSFAASFALLPSFDVSLNMLSLFAFMMVIGIVVDDAIVIGESIHIANEQGIEGDDAAIIGVAEVAKPVLFGVLTTMVVFAPMAFLPGSTAEYTRAISIVVVLALSFSIFEALLILPSHLRHLQNKPQASAKTPGKFALFQRRVANSMSYLGNDLYGPLLQRMLKHKYAVITLFVGSLLVAVNLLANNYVKQSFMPKIGSDKIKLVVTMPENTTHERTMQVLAQINDGQQQLEQYVGTQGKQLVEHIYNQVWGTRIISEIKLVPAEIRGLEIEQASDRLQAYIDDIPDAEDIEFKSTLNAQDPKIGFVMRSQNTESLRAALNDLKSHLAKYQGVNLIRDSMDKGSTELVFTLKPGAETLGVNLRDVSKQVKQAYFGQEVQRIAKPGGDVRVKVRYSKQERESIDTLTSLNIRTKDGREIPLLSIVEIEERPGVQRIFRRDGAKIASLNAEYAGDDQYSLMQEIHQEFIPQWKKRHPEVQFGKGDRGADEENFIATVVRLEGLALLVSYMLMAVAFRSYMQPFLILSAIPFAFLGAVSGHLIHGATYTMFSMLGILAAAGVVINDNLVLVDAINRLRAKGLSAFAAVIAAGKLRFRPIVLTSLTTFIGLLPMLSAQSIQAKFLVPMVISLAYGVLFATIITLLFVPCLYLASFDVKKLWLRFYQSEYYPLRNNL